jgi:hypothetical protein
VAVLFASGLPAFAYASQGYTWKVKDSLYPEKLAQGYQGINAALSWVKEVSACPGGWNGSADYRMFDNTGLQRYRVVGKEDEDKSAGNGVILHNGDLVFPDNTVWHKSEGYIKAHQAGQYAWKEAGRSLPTDDCADDTAQYEYALNMPSALAIADAWDGAKNLASGLPGSHKADDGYYLDSRQSWYRDIGSGAGSSRLPLVEEYKKANEGSSTVKDNLLYGTNNYAQYQWSGEQADDKYSIRSYSSAGNTEGKELVSYPLGGCWVVEEE